VVQIEPEGEHPSLPMAGARRERADAAANRRRILGAARQLLAEKGAQGLTMQAVASAAGVGKATVFHRFGDRAGLTNALVDAYMREFQDDFLAGEPPLGPGAPPRERLEAFLVELIARQLENIDIALAAESVMTEDLPPVYAALLLHVTSLVAEIDPQLESGVIAGYLLSTVSPQILHRLHKQVGVDITTLQRAAIQLVRGLTSARSAPPAV
jgi:AcrR family transcriptional regulator